MLRLIVLFVVLSGCNAPSMHFQGVPTTRVAVNGSTFDVRVKGNLAEALRVNPEYAPRFGPIRHKAGIAMARVSGCEVVDVLGDQSLATGVLACEGQDHADWLIRTAVATPIYDCFEQNDWAVGSRRSSYRDYECSPR